MRSCPTVLCMVIMIFVGLTCSSVSFGESKLIQVKPSYSESSYQPAEQIQGETGYAYTPPNPRDQMYVFWILGKMLSYPIDRVEDFISSKLRSSETPKPVAAPAVATSRPNPFDSVNFREIPPAPPAR